MLMLAPVRFASTLVIDNGGSGMRMDVAMRDGRSFPDPNDPEQFDGVANISYRTIKGKLTPQGIFKGLTERFIKKRLGDQKLYDGKKLLDHLKADPIDRVLVATAGQIVQHPTGFQMISAAANMPIVLQDMDFLGAFRKTFSSVMATQGLSGLVNEAKLKQNGWIFNDALGGLMDLARILEKRFGKPLDEATGSHILLDVGSGVATGDISGNTLSQSEDQNTATWFKPLLDPAILALDATKRTRIVASETPTFEDFASMRGITEQTLVRLKLTQREERQAHPAYLKLREVALAKDNLKPEHERLFKGNEETFNKYFFSTPTSQMKTLAWKERWVDVKDIIKTSVALQETQGKDPVVTPVMEHMVDALAALGANKVMAKRAENVFIQFIDLEKALTDLNAERTGKPPLTNVLAQAVQERMASYLHGPIASNFFKGVEVISIRNNEGLGYLPAVFDANRTNPWHIGGHSQAQLRGLLSPST